MAASDSDFDSYAKKLSEKQFVSRLTLADKKELYGLWCVATRGRCTRPEPSRLNMLAHGKWTAWKKYDHLSMQEARAQFVERAKSVVREMSKL